MSDGGDGGDGGGGDGCGDGGGGGGDGGSDYYYVPPTRDVYLDVEYHLTRHISRELVTVHETVQPIQTSTLYTNTTYYTNVYTVTTTVTTTNYTQNTLFLKPVCDCEQPLPGMNTPSTWQKEIIVVDGKSYTLERTESSNWQTTSQQNSTRFDGTDAQTTTSQQQVVQALAPYAQSWYAGERITGVTDPHNPGVYQTYREYYDGNTGELVRETTTHHPRVVDQYHDTWVTDYRNATIYVNGPDQTNNVAVTNADVVNYQTQNITNNVHLANTFVFLPADPCPEPPIVDPEPPCTDCEQPLPPDTPVEPPVIPEPPCTDCEQPIPPETPDEPPPVTPEPPCDTGCDQPLPPTTPVVPPILPEPPVSVVPEPILPEPPVAILPEPPVISDDCGCGSTKPGVNLPPALVSETTSHSNNNAAPVLVAEETDDALANPTATASSDDTTVDAPSVSDVPDDVGVLPLVANTSLSETTTDDTTAAPAATTAELPTAITSETTADTDTTTTPVVDNVAVAPADEPTTPDTASSATPAAAPSVTVAEETPVEETPAIVSDNNGSNQQTVEASTTAAPTPSVAAPPSAPALWESPAANPPAVTQPVANQPATTEPVADTGGSAVALTPIAPSPSMELADELSTTDLDAWLAQALADQAAYGTLGQGQQGGSNQNGANFVQHGQNFAFLPDGSSSFYGTSLF